MTTRRPRTRTTPLAPIDIVVGPLLRSVGALTRESAVPGGTPHTAPRGLTSLLVPRFYFDDDRDRPVRMPRALAYGHRVDILEMCLALSGSPLLVVEGTVFRLWDERLAILAPGVRHFETCGNRARPYELVWFILRPSASSMHVTSYDPVGGYAVRTRAALGRPGPAVDDVARCASALARPGGNVTALKVALTSLAGSAARFLEADGGGGRDSNVSGAVSMARDFIRAHFAERLSVADVAEAAHLSPNYLSTVFKEATGTTVLEQIHELKLAEARSRLTGSGEAVKRIATELGFENQHYFSRFFKRATGLTPSAFRTSRA